MDMCQRYVLYSKLVDMYFSDCVMIYPVTYVHLLLINGPERDKFCS